MMFIANGSLGMLVVDCRQNSDDAGRGFRSSEPSKSAGSRRRLSFGILALKKCTNVVQLQYKKMVVRLCE